MTTTIDPTVALSAASPAASQRYKWFVLFTLYVAQTIPSAFFDTALPVLLRQNGISLASIGMLKWIALPVVLKFLWAPAVDRYGSERFGVYKTWIFPMQIVTIACTLALTQFDWLTNFGLFLVIAFVWSTAAATQDIGVDGLAVRSLAKEERPGGVSLQNFSMLIGSLIGGGAMVVALSRIGFNNAMLILTGVLALPLLVLLRYKEPAAPAERTVVGMKSIVAMFKREGMLLWMAQILLLIGGAALSSPMTTPMLVDQGVALEKFGFLYGVIFPAVAGVSTMLAPVVLRKIGRKRVIVGSAAFICLHLANLILIDQLRPSIPVVFAILAFGAFTNMFLLIGIATVFMDLCRPETAATDWTVQMSVLAVAGPVFGGTGGFIAQAFGYTPLFAIGIAMTIVGIFIVLRHLGDGYLIKNPQIG